MSDAKDFSFENNTSDKMAAVVKSVGGLIPVVGNVLGEIVASTIPHQRLDRVVEYLMILKKFISEEELKKIKELPEKIALIEEGMYAVGYSTQKGRVERLSYVIVNGINKKELDVDHQIRIINTVKQLSEIDAIVLDYHSQKYPAQIDAFRKKHSTLLKDNKKIKISKQNLGTMLLLQVDYDFDFSSWKNHSLDQLPDMQEAFDKQKEQLINPKYSDITELGREVLAAIKEPQAVEMLNAP